MNIKFPKITIYDKYIFRQVAGATIGAVLLFTIVWIAPEILLNTIRDALDGKYDFHTAFILLYYELPKIVDKAIPVGLLLGTLFTFDKLSKDSEMTIFRAVGMSFQRIVAPVVVFALQIKSDKGGCNSCPIYLYTKGQIRTSSACCCCCKGNRQKYGKYYRS